MVAYVIVDMQGVTDADKLAAYRPHGAAAVEKYGGRYLARGGRLDPLEGNWQSQRISILAFDTIEQARTWYDSPEYAAARRMRAGAAELRMMVVEGLGSPA